MMILINSDYAQWGLDIPGRIIASTYTCYN